MQFLAASAALLSAANAVQVWTSHPNYEACASISNGPQICQRKFYTVTEHPLVEGWEAEHACDDLDAYPWCPESEEESVEVYANMALFEYRNAQGHLDIGKWAADGISKWTGVQIDPNFNAHTKELTNHVCVKPLKSEDGVLNYGWDYSHLDSTIFYAGDDRKQHDAKCVAMGEGLTFKWGHVNCEDPRKNAHDNMFKKRAVCVTTRDMSHDPNHEEMDMEAPEIIKREFKAIIDALATAALIFFLFMVTIFTGCCFCCCCCCCFKPCRSGDSEPVVTETVTTTQAAAPAAAPMPAAPAPAPYMPPAPAPAPAPMMQPMYGQPAYGMQQPMQQPMGGMGGINLNISNNNTNTNR